MQNVTQGVYDTVQGREVIQEPSDGAVAFSLALWAVTIAVGVPGNALMTVTIGYTASLRTAMNTYLLSIGLVDFLTCALLLPLRVYVNHIERTQKAIPHTMHSAELFIRTGTEAARLLLMLSLSVERYQAIARPFSVSKVQASWRALIVSGFTCGAAVLVSTLAMHYFCDSVLFMHCLRDDSDSPTRWGTLELYVELPLTVLSVLAIAVSYSLIVVVLRQQSRKMRSHSKGKAKPSQVVPVDHHVGAVSPLKKDTLRHFIVQTTEHNDLSRHTDATVSTTADSDISPVVTDDKSEPLRQSPSSSTLVDVEAHQKESCYTRPEVKHLSDAKLVVRDKLGIISEVSSALEISLDGETNRQPLQLDHDLAGRIFVSAVGGTNNKKTAASEDKQILTKTLRTGVYSAHSPSFSRPDSPYLSRFRLLKTPSLTFSARGIRDYQTQGKLVRTRSSFHGFVNSFSSTEMHFNTHSELPYLYRDDFFKNWCINNADTADHKTVYLPRSPLRRSKSEVSTLIHPAGNCLCNVLYGEVIFPKTSRLHNGNANFAQPKSLFTDHSTEAPCEICRSDTPNCGAPIDTTRQSSCHIEDGLQGVGNPSLPMLMAELRVINIEQAKDISDNAGGGNFPKKTNSQAESAQVSKDFPTQDSEAIVFLNEHFDRNAFVTTASGHSVGAEATIAQEDVHSCAAALEERMHENKSLDTGSNVDFKSGMDNVQKTVGLDTEPNRNTDANQSVQNSVTSCVTVIAHTTTDKSVASGKTEDAKLVEVVEMDGTVRIEIQPEASANQFEGAVCLMNPRNKEQGRRRVELKAALKVGLLFCTYVCLWAPLPVLVVYMKETYGWREKLKLDLLVMFSSLATSTAAVDPIIYGLLNRQIRSAAVVAVKKLKKKLRERFRSDI